MKSERGFAFPELLVSMLVFGIVLAMIMQMVQVTTKNQERITQRVVASQRARPVMAQLMNNMRSACFAPGVAPVLANSNASSITYLARTGSAAVPVPDKRVVTLSGTTLSETVYPATGTTPPWTFSSTPISNRELLTDVALARSGASTVPVFRYYELGYVAGKLTPIPLGVPLSAASAAKTAMVSVAFSGAPSGTKAARDDPTASLSLTDTATLRLEAGNPDVTRPNLPCV